MVGQYIPTIMGLGALLCAYKFWGADLFQEITAVEIQDTYDYVIVGAGTTGATFASRLTEQENITALLLEAGGEGTDNPSTDIPILADQVRGSSLDWQFKTIPQRHACKGHVDQSAVWPSGKGLGGSSLLNYMQYLRGSRHDYDEWANQGAIGWAYKDVLPYFIKSEDNRNPKYVRTVFHGYGGRLTVQDVSVTPATSIMTQAFTELGVKIRDTNGRNIFGYAPTQATIRSGVRWDTYKAFLQRAMNRHNLHILTHATVTKILFDGKRAVGVQYVRNGKVHIAKVRKDVILSAGTVGSPKLLMLSGVGPKLHLQAMKIPVVADLPVGDNLQDHVMSDGIPFYTPHTVSASAAKAENFVSSWQYSLYGGGMKKSPRFREGTAFIRLKNQPRHLKYPMVALHVIAHPVAYEHDQINVKEDTWASMHGKPPSKEGITVLPVLLHPRSKGTVRLRSNKPEDAPLINPNYLAEDADVKALVEAIHFIRKVLTTTVFKNWEFEANDNLLPQCLRFGNNTDSYLECFVRHITLSGYSPVGTCKMGARGDPTTVVDPQLRVRGLKGLRVIDASVFPTSVSGNTYTAQIMLGEKAADLLREIDSVKPIKDYFKHLIAVKHDKFKEE